VPEPFVRRIGYTTGLFDLFRMGRVVDLFAKTGKDTREPTRPKVALVKQIMEAFADKEMSQSYARGVLDVAESLMLVRHTGEVYALTWQGEAYYALAREDSWPAPRPWFFLRRILEADSDYTLNILDLVASGASPSSVEEQFLDRVSCVLEKRRAEVDLLRERYRFDYKTKVSEALAAVSRAGGNGGNTSVPDIARHHVRPRMGWLRDLGLIEGDRSLKVTGAGGKLLSWLASKSWTNSGCIVVPVDEPLLELGQAGFRPEHLSEATTSVWGEGSSRPMDRRSLFERVLAFYPVLRSPAFNQVSYDALAETLELVSLAEGVWVNGYDCMEEILREYPDQFSRLTSEGRVAYLSLRRGS
jgi:hypothetical protein